jgi:hypothetical protein
MPLFDSNDSLANSKSGYCENTFYPHGFNATGLATVLVGPYNNESCQYTVTLDAWDSIIKQKSWHHVWAEAKLSWVNINAKTAHSTCAFIEDVY